MRALRVNWADFPPTLRTYELIACYVVPRLRGDNEDRMANTAEGEKRIR